MSTMPAAAPSLRLAVVLHYDRAWNTRYRAELRDGPIVPAYHHPLAPANCVEVLRKLRLGLRYIDH